MLSKIFFSKLKKEYEKKEIERRKIISASNQILHASKRVIFGLHRGDIGHAETSLNLLEKEIKTMQKNFGFTRLEQEGAYKAAIEEYVEGRLLYLVYKGKNLNSFSGLKIATDSYLGGLCDLTGEMVRYSTNLAAEQKFDKVEQMLESVRDIIGELVQFDMTGYLRTKYDQAKHNLKKMEQINYEIKIRK